jgi:hypothetical protein
MPSKARYLIKLIKVITNLPFDLVVYVPLLFYVGLLSKIGFLKHKFSVVVKSRFMPIDGYAYLLFEGII